MSSNSARPKWWQLYLTLPVLIALFVMDGRLKISSRGHQAVQIAIVLLVYGLIRLWLKANARALSAMDQRQYGGSFRVIEIGRYQMRSSDDNGQPMLQLPTSEVKGILSNTFEINYIDADAFPVEEVPQDMKKEQK